MAKSRLSRKFEKKSKETLVLSLIGIVLLLIIILKYGIPFITDLSFNIGQVSSGLTNKTDKTGTKEDPFVPVPSLDALPKATKNQTITVAGTSLTGLKVQLYLNGSEEDSATVDSNGNFVFRVSLSEGDNIIKARSVKGESQSDFSDSVNVVYKKTNPNLTIDSPHEGDNIGSEGSPLQVSGKTDPDVSVTVNGFQAIISQNGDYSYSLTLKGGGNDIKVTGTDAAGNKTEKSIHVNYSQ